MTSGSVVVLRARRHRTILSKRTRRIRQPSKPASGFSSRGDHCGLDPCAAIAMRATRRSSSISPQANSGISFRGPPRELITACATRSPLFRRTSPLEPHSTATASETVRRTRDDRPRQSRIDTGGNATPTSDGGPIDEPGRDERSSASPRFRFSRPASRSKGKTIWVDPIEKVRRPSNAGLRVLRMGRPIAACPAAALALLRERKTLLIDLAPSLVAATHAWFRFSRPTSPPKDYRPASGPWGRPPPSRESCRGARDEVHKTLLIDTPKPTAVSHFVDRRAN